MSEVINLPKTVIVEKDLESLMTNFISNRIQDLKNIKSSVESGNWQEAYRFAHIIAGVAGGYGFHELTQQARLLEDMIQKKEFAQIIPIVEQLITYMGEVTIVYQ